MPWSPNDAQRHTKKAATPEKRKVWSKVANQVLSKTNDEGRAVREANAVTGRIGHGKKKKGKHAAKPKPKTDFDRMAEARKMGMMPR